MQSTLSCPRRPRSAARISRAQHRLSDSSIVLPRADSESSQLKFEVSIFDCFVFFFFCFDSFIYNPLHASRRAMAAAAPLPFQVSGRLFKITFFLPRTSLSLIAVPCKPFLRGTCHWSCFHYVPITYKHATAVYGHTQARKNPKPKNDSDTVLIQQHDMTTHPTSLGAKLYSLPENLGLFEISYI